MIIFIEIPNPTNHWAEPGDEISPEEVIRLFESDPGLRKNSKISHYSLEDHYPKHFSTWGRLGGQKFDEIEDVEELKRRLVIPEERLLEIDQWREEQNDDKN